MEDIFLLTTGFYFRALWTEQGIHHGNLHLDNKLLCFNATEIIVLLLVVR